MCVGDGYENEIVDLVPLVSDSSLCQVKNCRHVFWPVEHLCDQYTLPPLKKLPLCSVGCPLWARWCIQARREPGMERDHQYLHSQHQT